LFEAQTGSATLVIAVDQFEELLGDSAPPDCAYRKIETR
jgi:hypothetical protein